MNHCKLIFLVLFIGVFQVDAHVSLVTPTGGEVFEPGDMVQITWEENIEHDLQYFHLNYSLDGGENWLVIQKNIEPGIFSYTWQVPETETAMAQIQVIQDNITYTDFDSKSQNFTITSNPEEMMGEEPDEMDMEMVTNIETSTASQLSAYPNPFHSEITFVVPNANVEQSVTINIYNLSGQKVVSLSNDFSGSNSHEIIWIPSNIEAGIYMVYIDKSHEQEILKLVYEP